jgi:hypothetical protein
MMQSSRVTGIEEAFQDYTFCHSYNLPTEVTCFICRLELPCDMQSMLPLSSDLYLSAQIISNQIPLHGCRMNTCFGNIDRETNVVFWDEVLSFPVKYRDLTIDSILVISVSDSVTVYGGTAISFYDENSLIKTGFKKSF